MKISSFKFGETPLYVVDGIVTRGVIQVRRSPGMKWTAGIFLFALIFFVGTAAFTSGRSYVARFQYALGLYAVGENALASSESPVATDVVSSTLPLPTQAPATPSISVSPVPIVHKTTETPQAVISPENTVRTGAAAKISSNRIGIPRLKIEAPLVETSLTMKAVNADLQKGVIRWPDSDLPGADGTTVILGHSSAPLSYRGKYGSVFALLDKLIPGDIITLTYNGELISYRVRDQVIIDPKKNKPDFSAGTDTESIVLVSCWPVGTNWQRIAIRAERVY